MKTEEEIKEYIGKLDEAILDTVSKLIGEYGEEALQIYVGALRELAITKNNYEDVLED